MVVRTVDTKTSDILADIIVPLVTGDGYIFGILLLL